MWVNCTQFSVQILIRHHAAGFMLRPFGRGEHLKLPGSARNLPFTTLTVLCAGVSAYRQLAAYCVEKLLVDLDT